MPRPLSLSAEPAAAVHIAAPQEVLGTVAAYAPTSDSSARALVGYAVSQMAARFETDVVASVDLTRPWSAAVVDGQTIVHLPIVRHRLQAVKFLLADRPPEGTFGAVKLERPAGDAGPKLAYLDGAAATLTLADDLRGIATGTEIAARYGKNPVFITLDRAQALRFGIALPVERITVQGKGGHDFQLVTQGIPQRPELDLITEGALTGTLESPSVAVGFSTKYTHYEKEVRAVLGQAKRSVDQQNFIVRGVLAELLNRASTVLRSWNGRVMVGVGPSRHVLLAFGADDPNRASGATLHLIGGVLDNIKLAGQFGVAGGIPKIRFARNKTMAGATAVHVVALERAKKYLPPELHGLIGDRGDLRVAFAFDARMGGAMVVAGPDASNVLAQWIGEIRKATPGHESKGDLFAATLAVRPESLAPLLRQGAGAEALRLNAERKPTKVVVHRKSNSLHVRVTGPVLQPQPPTATAHTSPARTRAIPTRTAPRSAGRQSAPPRTRGKPVR